MKPTRQTLMVTATFVVGIGLAVAAFAFQDEAAPSADAEQAAPPAASVRADASGDEAVPATEDLEYWTQRFEADSNPEMALYLSAVQYMEWGMLANDMDGATKAVTRIASTSTSQKVRTACRRLLVEYYLAKGDAASARTQLETIVQENLTQF